MILKIVCFAIIVLSSSTLALECYTCKVNILGNNIIKFLFKYDFLKKFWPCDAKFIPSETCEEDEVCMVEMKTWGSAKLYPYERKCAKREEGEILTLTLYVCFLYNR